MTHNGGQLIDSDQEGETIGKVRKAFREQIKQSATPSELMLAPDQLSKCRLVTSSLSITPEKVVFATPSVIVVQDSLHRNATNTDDSVLSKVSHFERFLAFRRPDGSCREEGSMRLHCEVAPGMEDQHCKEYSTAVGSGPCFATAPGVCQFLGPSPWIEPEIAAGLLDAKTILDSSVLQIGEAQPDQQRHVLILGVGAGSVPGYISQHFANTRVTAVDIDPDVLFAAQHFFLQGGSEDQAQGRQVTLVQGDALTKLKEQEDKSLDSIFMDAYDPHDKAATGLYSDTGLAIAKDKLRSDGRVIIEVNIDSQGGRMEAVSNSLRKLGFNKVAHSAGSSESFVLGVLGDGGSIPEGLSTDTLEEIKKWNTKAGYTEATH